MPFRGGGVHPIALGRLPSFSQILYKNFMYFRVWGNYGHTPDTWHGHVIGQRTSQYGQQQTFSTMKNGDPKAAAVTLILQIHLHSKIGIFTQRPFTVIESQAINGVPAI